VPTEEDVAITQALRECGVPTLLVMTKDDRILDKADISAGRSVYVCALMHTYFLDVTSFVCLFARIRNIDSGLDRDRDCDRDSSCCACICSDTQEDDDKARKKP
jgi:hypothetical protein